MRFPYLLALIMMVTLASVQWYQSTKYICPVPISYRLGVIDESFTLSEAKAKQYIEQAEVVWENVADQELFIYDEEADFTINFVFDERQQSANAQTADRERLDSIAAQNEQFRVQIDQLQTSYETRQLDFTSSRAAYDDRLQTYNQRVQQINDQGGAVPDVFSQLEQERITLDAASEELRIELSSLQDLAQQLNGLSQEGNRLVETYNQEVRAYNETYGTAHEFTQGDYRGGEINIYKFSDEFELVSVLVHEFGHALGIGHVEEPGSLMYYLLDDELTEIPELTPADIAAFQMECKDLGLGGTVRAFIRSTLAKL